MIPPNFIFESSVDVVIWSYELSVWIVPYEWDWLYQIFTCYEHSSGWDDVHFQTLSNSQNASVWKYMRCSCDTRGHLYLYNWRHSWTSGHCSRGFWNIFQSVEGWFHMCLVLWCPEQHSKMEETPRDSAILEKTPRPIHTTRVGHRNWIQHIHFRTWMASDCHKTTATTPHKIPRPPIQSVSGDIGLVYWLTKIWNFWLPLLIHCRKESRTIFFWYRRQPWLQPFYTSL